MTGTDKGFEEDKTLTRAEAAAIIIRMKGIEDNTVNEFKDANIFTDVPLSHWANGYICLANKLGILKGAGDGTFMPDKNVSIAEFVTMIVRVFGYGSTAEAKDSTWPVNYINYANENGLLDDVFELYKEDALRKHASIMIADGYKFYKEVPSVNVNNLYDKTPINNVTTQNNNTNNNTALNAYNAANKGDSYIIMKVLSNSNQESLGGSRDYYFGSSNPNVPIVEFTTIASSLTYGVSRNVETDRVNFTSYNYSLPCTAVGDFTIEFILTDANGHSCSLTDSFVITNPYAQSYIPSYYQGGSSYTPNNNKPVNTTKYPYTKQRSISGTAKSNTLPCTTSGSVIVTYNSVTSTTYEARINVDIIGATGPCMVEIRFDKGGSTTAIAPAGSAMAIATGNGEGPSSYTVTIQPMYAYR